MIHAAERGRGGRDRRPGYGGIANTLGRNAVPLRQCAENASLWWAWTHPRVGLCKKFCLLGAPCRLHFAGFNVHRSLCTVLPCNLSPCTVSSRTVSSRTVISATVITLARRWSCDGRTRLWSRRILARRRYVPITLEFHASSWQLNRGTLRRIISFIVDARSRSAADLTPLLA